MWSKPTKVTGRRTDVHTDDVRSQYRALQDKTRQDFILLNNFKAWYQILNTTYTTVHRAVKSRWYVIILAVEMSKSVCDYEDISCISILILLPVCRRRRANNYWWVILAVLNVFVIFQHLSVVPEIIASGCNFPIQFYFAGLYFIRAVIGQIPYT